MRQVHINLESSASFLDLPIRPGGCSLSSHCQHIMGSPTQRTDEQVTSGDAGDSGEGKASSALNGAHPALHEGTRPVVTPISLGWVIPLSPGLSFLPADSRHCPLAIEGPPSAPFPGAPSPASLPPLLSYRPLLVLPT